MSKVTQRSFRHFQKCIKPNSRSRSRFPLSCQCAPSELTPLAHQTCLDFSGWLQAFPLPPTSAVYVPSSAAARLFAEQPGLTFPLFWGVWEQKPTGIQALCKFPKTTAPFLEVEETPGSRQLARSKSSQSQR